MASPKQPKTIPFKCPKCPPKHFYGKLFIPWDKDQSQVMKCENCETVLVES